MNSFGSATAPAFTPAPLADSIWTPVLATFDETADIRTFRVARPRGFDFQAGQSLGVRIEVGGRVHDRRYSIDSSKLRGLGWERTWDFADGLKQTVEWFAERRDWWEPIKSGEYLAFYREQYAERLGQ